MQIYIDADSCPKTIKEAVYKIVVKQRIKTTLVAAQFMQVPLSEFISLKVVPEGMNAADDKIVELVQEGELVITSDIPLADQVVGKNAFVLSPRGELMTQRNIKERLAMRDFMTEMRENGIVSGGPAPFSDRDRQNFINELHKFVIKRI